jgi:PAS domain S-box-containing protein
MGKQVRKLNTEEFSRGVRNARGRLDELRKEAVDIFSSHPLMMETFEELQSTVEELETAEEELFQQFEELLAARNALDNERVRYQGLFDFAPYAYIVTNKEGAIIEANRAASILLEVSPKFIIRKLLASYVDEQDRRNFRSEMSKLTQATGVQEIEMRLKPRLRESFDASLRVGPVRNNEGKVVALRWMIRNITYRKLTEERIRKANEELEQRVRERTSELEAANKLKEDLLVQSRRAYDRAEAANRAKDEFLAMVSHELRTPLNAVIGWAEILRTRANDPLMVRNAIEVIERNARAQAQIIEDILEVSRLMAATPQLEFQPVELRSIIEKAIEAASPAARAAGHHLRSAIDESVGPVLGDADRLAQVVGNLIANSIKFTPPDGRIAVKLAREGGQAQIIVSDTGKGITADFLPHVFDSFSQADNSSRRKYGGLGLGLAIARRFIEMHGGAITAESHGENLGATFIVSLPFMKEVQEAFNDVVEAGEAEPGSVEALSRQIEGIWILAVDDQADTLDMLRIVLEQLGAKVTTALSCAEAMRVIEGESCPDVLVADIAMPEENGFDLIRKIRRMDPDRGGSIPAIALTAYAGEEDRARVLAEGYQLHLAKPVSIQELVPSIAKLAHRRDEHG